MKKFLILLSLALMGGAQAFAGGLLTNTNQNAAFLRMIARGAAIDIDGVYSNPAGLAFLPDNGFHLSLTIQSASQNRDILATSPIFSDSNGSKLFHGKASAPVIPSFHAAYKHNKYTISAGFGITGGGGKCSFDDGLPMFTGAAIGLISSLTNGAVTPNMYTVNSAMDGRQYIYGFQAGLSYKFNEHIAAFVGARMNYFSGNYNGHLKLQIPEQVMQAMGTGLVQQLVPQYMNAGMTYEQAMQAAAAYAQGLSTQLNDGIELDCDQTGWGINPILGIDAKFGKLNLAGKYEFRTSLNIENKTHKLVYPTAAEGLLDDFKHGVNTPSDIPSLLSLAAGYEILPNLRANVEWHFFDDKSAHMAGDKQKNLERGTYEYLAGVEWDINKYVTVSGGYQRTDYGLSDNFQSDTSFSCDSYSLGFGARVNATKKLSVDVAYFWTTYEDYNKKDVATSAIPIDRTYSRTNKVFGVSLNYNF